MILWLYGGSRWSLEPMAMVVVQLIHLAAFFWYFKKPSRQLFVLVFLLLYFAEPQLGGSKCRTIYTFAFAFAFALVFFLSGSSVLGFEIYDYVFYFIFLTKAIYSSLFKFVEALRYHLYFVLFIDKYSYEFNVFTEFLICKAIYMLTFEIILKNF